MFPAAPSSSCLGCLLLPPLPCGSGGANWGNEGGWVGMMPLCCDLGQAMGKRRVRDVLSCKGCAAGEVLGRGWLWVLVYV